MSNESKRTYDDKQYLTGLYNMVKYALMIRHPDGNGITDDIIRSTIAETISFFEIEAPKNAEYRELVRKLHFRMDIYKMRKEKQVK